MAENYHGPHFGYFNKAIDKVGKLYTTYIKTDVVQEADGSYVEQFTKTTVFGSLQDFHKKQTYSIDGSNLSSREGKFFCKYEVNLYEGDLIKKNDRMYRVTDMDDYDFHGVKVYSVVRLGLDETRTLMTRWEVREKEVKLFEDQKVNE